jgi:ParB-like chromosome segregation protein Spo0J
VTHTSIHAEDIHTGERQRKEFKDKELIDLADSILRVGLIHAPVITQDYTLVAGERRLRALAVTESSGKYQYGGEDYEYPEVPVHIVPYNDPKLLFEIELEENLRRVNLTPMEEAQAIAKLHEVRLVEAPAQTMKETAKEVAELKGKEPTARDEERVANAILIEQFKDDPEVIKAGKVSLNKAAKVARKKMEFELLRALTGSSEAPPNSMFTMYAGRAEDVLGGFSPASFDVLLFDPPYGIGADKFGEQAMDLGHQYTDTEEDAASLIHYILAAGQEVLKPDAHVLMFCAFELFPRWKKTYEAFGYSVWPRPLIWSKGQQAHVPVPDYGPRYSYECILFAQRGRRKINQLINDVLHFPPPRDKIHAAEKPAELLAALLDFVAKPGDRVLDPCAGSGSIFIGGRGKEVFITGIEVDANYYAVAKERADR